MKHSKLVMTVAASFLAIVGVAATKAHRFTQVGYYNNGSGSCTTETIACVTGTTANCRVDGHLVYTKYTTSACNSSVLNYNGE